jgi:hypothetical protein
LIDALDDIVPHWDGAGDWSAVRSSAHARARRRRASWGIVAAALLVPLLATPAFGLRQALLGWVGRIDRPFGTSHKAPLLVRKEFYDLDVGAPGSWAIRPLADEVRRVATFPGGATLYAVQTAGGGFCWQFTGPHGHMGCLAHKPPRRTSINASYSVAGSVDVPRALVSADGFVLPHDSARLVAKLADGSERDVPFVFVSAPINAGFFEYDVPRAEQTAAKRVEAFVLLDRHGHELGRQSFDYTAHPGRAAAQRARARKLLGQHHRYLPQLLPARPAVAPSAPLQRASADGVNVVAGRNGVVLFDLRNVGEKTREMLGTGVGVGCIRFRSFHGLPDNREITFSGRHRGTVAVRIEREAPFDACEIQGGYGHTWPDRNGNHSAVELPFNARATRYFTDRAAARDLALFARSRRVHAIRKLPGAQIGNALASAYGGAIQRGWPSIPSRIGYLVAGDTLTLVEQSPTGRRFVVTFRGGHLVHQNIKPYAFVF